MNSGMMGIEECRNNGIMEWRNYVSLRCSSWNDDGSKEGELDKISTVKEYLSVQEPLSPL